MLKTEEIRIHGRGGQGVVTAAELIAIAGFRSGLEAQSFPNFGVERSGAPIQAFARLSSEKILTREQVTQPSVLIIQDSTLLKSPEIFKGVTPDTLIIINGQDDGSKIIKSLKKSYARLFFSPATAIAMEILGRNIVNTVILGAFARHSGLISLPALKEAIKEKLSNKGADIVKKNIRAASKAFYA